jgi:hypothetical protein
MGYPMTYLPNNPVANQTLKSSQPQLQGNFQVIENIYNSEHFPFTESDPLLQGKHKHITLPASAVAPSPPANQLALYAKSVSGASELFLKRDNDPTEHQITIDGMINSTSWDMVSSVDLLSSPPVSFNDFKIDYDYKFVFYNVKPPATGGLIGYQFSTDNGVTFDTSNLYDTEMYYAYQGVLKHVSQSNINHSYISAFFSNVIYNTPQSNFCGELIVFNPGDTSGRKLTQGSFCYTAQSGRLVNLSTSGLYKNNSVVNAIRFEMISQSFGSGRITMYKRKIL